MAIFKVYDCENNALFFTSLTDLRSSLDLTAEETRACHATGSHMMSNGTEVITYRD